MNQRLFGLFSVALVAVLASPAGAQHFDVQQLRPAPSQQTNYFGVRSAEVLGSGEWDTGLFLHFSDDLLVIRDSRDNQRLA